MFKINFDLQVDQKFKLKFKVLVNQTKLKRRKHNEKKELKHEVIISPRKYNLKSNILWSIY